MLKLAINETASDRRVAFKCRDFVVVIAERGWSDFYNKTPEMRKPSGDDSILEFRSNKKWSDTDIRIAEQKGYDTGYSHGSTDTKTKTLMKKQKEMKSC